MGVYRDLVRDLRARVAELEEENDRLRKQARPVASAAKKAAKKA